MGIIILPNKSLYLSIIISFSISAPGKVKIKLVFLNDCNADNKIFTCFLVLFLLIVSG